jgi:hypothetical protein
MAPFAEDVGRAVPTATRDVLTRYDWRGQAAPSPDQCGRCVVWPKRSGGVIHQPQRT